MCWYSAEHSGQQLLQAEVGERLCIRQIYGHARWVVRESDATEKKPKPVCLLNETRVLFRPHGNDDAPLGIDTESEAIFRMLTVPKRDVFEFQDGRQLEVNSLPPGLLFDVLAVPGKEALSAILAGDEQFDEEAEVSADRAETESLLSRVLRLF